MRYNGDADKPISVIITTLATRAYDNEADLVDALLNIVCGMREGVAKRDGILWVPNPVNPQENFADKWSEEPRKQEIFFEWLEAVEREHRYLLTDQGLEKAGEYLPEAYGKRDAKAAMINYASRRSGKGTPATPVILVPRQHRRSEEPEHQSARLTKPSKPWGR